MRHADIEVLIDEMHHSFEHLADAIEKLIETIESSNRRLQASEAAPHELAEK